MKRHFLHLTAFGLALFVVLSLASPFKFDGSAHRQSSKPFRALAEFTDPLRKLAALKTPGDAALDLELPLREGGRCFSFTRDLACTIPGNPQNAPVLNSYIGKPCATKDAKDEAWLSVSDKSHFLGFAIGKKGELYRLSPQRSKAEAAGIKVLIEELSAPDIKRAVLSRCRVVMPVRLLSHSRKSLASKKPQALGKRIQSSQRSTKHTEDSAAVKPNLAAGTTALASVVNNPPTVNITSPTMNYVHNPGSTMTIQATASDSDGSISKVEFFNGTTLIGTSTVSPYSLKIGNLQPANFSLTAKATDNSGATTTSPPIVTTVAINTNSPSYPNNTFTYSETYSDPNITLPVTLKMMIPTDIPVIRGLFINFGASGEDTRDKYKANNGISEFAHLHGFGYIGSLNSPSGAARIPDSFFDSYVFRALADLAAQSKHPEIVNVPWVLFGTSAGGGRAIDFAHNHPDRVIAISPVSGFNLADPPAAYIPTTYIIGEFDVPSIVNGADSYINGQRALGALASLTKVQGLDHAELAQSVLGFPGLDHAIKARYPSGLNSVSGIPILLNISESSGWLGNNATWTSGITQIADFNSYTGNKSTASWLIDKDLAYIYRAYATYNNPLLITSFGPKATSSNGTDQAPKPTILDPGNNAMIVVDPSGFPAWSKLDFYDGAQLKGTVSSGNPPQLLLTNLNSGLHTYSVLATDSSGNIQRTSYPVLVIVRGSPPGANLLPSAAITAPINNASFTTPVNITINATASDSDGTVSKVDFYQGTTFLGADTTSPYSFTWNNVMAGTYDLSVKATDNAGATTTSAVVKVTVFPPGNTVPIANSQVLSTNEDNSLSFSLSASDPNNDPLTYNIVSPPIHGTLSGTAPNLTYSPQANYNGSDNFTFKVNDGAVDSNLATVSLTVNAVNDAPVVKSGLAATPNPALTGQNVNLSVTVTDVDGDTLSYLWSFGDDTSTNTAQGSVSHVFANAGNYQATVIVSDGTTPAPATNLTVAINPATGSSTALVSSVTLGTPRNDFSGWLGMKITVGATPIKVTELGRYMLNGNSQPHGLKLVNAGTKTDIAGGSTSVSMTGGNIGQFKYANLASPITLAANTSYYLVSQETAAGDSWGYDNTLIATSSAATCNGPVLSNTNGWSERTPANTTFVPLSFKYNVNPLNVKPSVSITAPANNASYTAPASITINAGATDSDGTVTKVDFYQGTTLLGTDTISPYSFSWNNVSAGSYTLTANATDDSGAVTTSSPVNITVTMGVSTALVSAVTLGSLRNDFSGWLGMKITVGATPIKVTELGRYMLNGNSQPHGLKLVNAGTKTDIAGGSTSVSMTGGNIGQFKYANLASPITLAANTSYYLVSQETAAGDSWGYDNTLIATSSAATCNGPVLSNTNGWSERTPANTTFVPLSFKYSLAGP